MSILISCSSKLWYVAGGSMQHLKFRLKIAAVPPPLPESIGDFSLLQFTGVNSFLAPTSPGLHRNKKSKLWDLKRSFKMNVLVIDLAFNRAIFRTDRLVVCLGGHSLLSRLTNFVRFIRQYSARRLCSWEDGALSGEIPQWKFGELCVVDSLHPGTIICDGTKLWGKESVRGGRGQ